MVRESGSETPPPGGGVLTATRWVPGVAATAAGTEAASWAAPMKRVETGVPSTMTRDVGRNADPETVICVSGIPIAKALGLIPVRIGATPCTANGRASDVPPPGLSLVTVIHAVCAVRRNPEGTTAVRVEALTSVVARAVPVQRTTDGLLPPMNPDPVTVSVALA